MLNMTNIRECWNVMYTTIAHYSPREHVCVCVCVSPESLSDLFDEIVVQIVQ